MQRLDAAYLHARLPSEARVVFFGVDGPEAVRAQLPDSIRDKLETISFEILLPSEEFSLTPITPAKLRESIAAARGEPEPGAVAVADETGAPGSAASEEERIVPALWRMPGLGMPLTTAIPALAAMEPTYEQPGLGFLVRAARLIQAMIDRGDFAPAVAPSEGGQNESAEESHAKPNLLRFVPYWREGSVRVLGGLAELVPTMLRTARFASHDDPVWAVSARNIAYSFVGHGLDACASDFEPKHESAERLPRTFWRTRPEPVLEILAPEQELEEGVPWGIQLGFRPVPGLPVHYPLEDLESHRARGLFQDSLALEGLEGVRDLLDRVSQKVPALAARDEHDGWTGVAEQAGARPGSRSSDVARERRVRDQPAGSRADAPAIGSRPAHRTESQAATTRGRGSTSNGPSRSKMAS